MEKNESVRGVELELWCAVYEVDLFVWGFILCYDQNFSITTPGPVKQHLPVISPGLNNFVWVLPLLSFPAHIFKWMAHSRCIDMQ